MLLRDVPRRAHHAWNEVFSENKSLLSNDKLVITFNFKNEPVTVPTSYELEAIEGSSDIEAFASPKKTGTRSGACFLWYPLVSWELSRRRRRRGVRNIAPQLPCRKPCRAVQILPRVTKQNISELLRAHRVVRICFLYSKAKCVKRYCIFSWFVLQ